MVFGLQEVAHSPGLEPTQEPGWALAATSAIRAAESRTRWAQDVVQALETLRPEERAYIQLSYFQGLGLDQIAELAEVSTSSVTRAIASGMRQVALMLEQG